MPRKKKTKFQQLEAKPATPAKIEESHSFDRNEEEELLDSRLSSLGFVRKPVPKDGACLFRAVAEKIYNTQRSHVLVRKECADFLEQHKHDFEPFLDVPFDHYIYEMRKVDTWGGQIELQALSLKYKVNFFIYSQAEKPTIIDNDFSKSILLSFSHGNHYDCVYPHNQWKNLIMCQDLVYDLFDTVFTTSDSQPARKINQEQKYKNIELECWMKFLDEMTAQDLALAKTFYGEETDVTTLSGYYKKGEGDEGWTKGSRKSRNNRNRQNNNTRLHFEELPLSKVEPRRSNENVPPKTKAKLNDDAAYPTLAKPTKQISVSSGGNNSPVTSSSSLASSVGTASNTNAWGQRKNWTQIFVPTSPQQIIVPDHKVDTALELPPNTSAKTSEQHTHSGDPPAQVQEESTAKDQNVADTTSSGLRSEGTINDNLQEQNSNIKEESVPAENQATPNENQTKERSKTAIEHKSENNVLVETLQVLNNSPTVLLPTDSSHFSGAFSSCTNGSKDELDHDVVTVGDVPIEIPKIHKLNNAQNNVFDRTTDLSKLSKEEVRNIRESDTPTVQHTQVLVNFGDFPPESMIFAVPANHQYSPSIKEPYFHPYGVQQQQQHSPQQPRTQHNQHHHHQPHIFDQYHIPPPVVFPSQFDPSHMPYDPSISLPHAPASGYFGHIPYYPYYNTNSYSYFPTAYYPNYSFVHQH